MLVMLRAPDVLVSGDGRHVGFPRLVPGRLVVLRETRSDFARDKLNEIAGMDGDVMPLEQVPEARCNADFCALEIRRGGRTWRLLLSRGADPVPLRDLAAACERVDIVIADRWLPRSCHPAVLRLDRHMLEQTGGVALDLADAHIDNVAQGQGEHGWWRVPPPPGRPTEAVGAVVPRQANSPPPAQ